MSENPKMQCLANDLVRRMMNTKEDRPDSFRATIIDKYGVKLMTSGYSKEQSRRILVSGMKGYLRKKERRKQAGRGGRIHLTSQESQQSRIRKKLIGKSSWYKSRKKEDPPHHQGGKGVPGKMKKDVAALKTRAVLFLEQTPQGELARRIKEQLQNLEPTLGYRIKVVERSGKSLQGIFSQSQVWQGQECGRTWCVTCNQGGEEKPPCTMSSLVYESMCRPCNPSCTKKGELKEQKDDQQSLYVGETSRSIQERALEHLGDARKGDPKSHMIKHQGMKHPGEPPDFYFKMVSTHRSALSRQVREAVRIRRRGGAGAILNSKGEFNRCHIPRLVVEEEDKEAVETRRIQEQAEKEEITNCMNEEESSWEKGKCKEREQRLKKRRRGSVMEEEGVRNGKPWGEKKMPKRLKYAILSEDWGEEAGEQHDQPQDDLPPPTVIRKSRTSKAPLPMVTSSVITDYFSPRPKRIRMDRSEQVPEIEDDQGEEQSKDDLEMQWTDEEGFDDLTQSLICLDDSSHPEMTLSILPESQEPDPSQIRSVMMTPLVPMPDRAGRHPVEEELSTAAHTELLECNQSDQDTSFVGVRIGGPGADVDGQDNDGGRGVRPVTRPDDNDTPGRCHEMSGKWPRGDKYRVCRGRT